VTFGIPWVHTKKYEKYRKEKNYNNENIKKS
jgi:hypothetical protein